MPGLNTTLRTRFAGAPPPGSTWMPTLLDQPVTAHEEAQRAQIDAYAHALQNPQPQDPMLRIAFLIIIAA